METIVFSELATQKIIKFIKKTIKSTGVNCPKQYVYVDLDTSAVYYTNGHLIVFEELPLPPLDGIKTRAWIMTPAGLKNILQETPKNISTETHFEVDSGQIGSIIKKTYAERPATETRIKKRSFMAALKRASILKNVIKLGEKQTPENIASISILEDYVKISMISQKGEFEENISSCVRFAGSTANLNIDYLTFLAKQIDDDSIDLVLRSDAVCYVGANPIMPFRV